MAKLIDKEALKKFNLLIKTIKENTDLDLFESEEEKKNRINKLKNDYGAFVKYYFPHYAKKECAKFQIDNANTIKDEPQVRRVIMWARAHAKTTHFGLFIPLWLKIQDKRDFNFMVFVSKSEDSAIEHLGNLQAELQYNHRYINDFGKQVKLGSWEDARFSTEDDCVFVALGRGQSPRGLNYKGHRPDYIILDDIEDDEIVLNPMRMKKLHDWTLEALFMTMAYGRGRFLCVGNKIHNDSLIAKFEANPKFKVTKVNALDENGNPSWPENYSKKEIESIIELIGERRAQKEMFNNPGVVEGTIFKSHQMQFKKLLNLSKYKEIIAYCDPSFKNTKTSDYKAIIILGYLIKEYHVLDALCRKCSITEMANFMFDFQDTLPSNQVVQFWMEANFAQDLLLDEFKKMEIQRNKLLLIRKDTRKKPDKFGRIENLSPLFERGMVFFNEEKKHKHDFITLIDQFLAFERGSRFPDDGPDAFEGGIHLINKSVQSFNSKYIIGKRKNEYRY